MTNTSRTYIARDTYTGKWIAYRKPSQCRAFTAAWLAANVPADDKGVIVLWERFGERDGKAMFCRTRFVADADGNLSGYDADGARKIIHPADRVIRIMTN